MIRIALLPLVVLCWLTSAAMSAADLPPVITSATATPATVITKATTLRAVATDEAPTTLTYTWSATGPAAVVFSSANGTVTGKTTTATFSVPGSYACTVAVADAAGQIATSAPVAVEVVPTLTSLSLTPSTTVVNQNTTVAFAVVAKDQWGIALAPQPAVTWAATGAGTIDAAGVFTAGVNPGPATVTATVGAKSVTRTLRVNAAPTIVTGAATATPTIIGKTAIFTAAGTDDMPVDELLYTWSAIGPKGVAFAPRSSVLGESTTATFAAIGTYTVTVRISDKQGLAVTSQLDVTVLPTPTSLTIAPSTGLVVNPGLTKPFVATVRDQFNVIMAPQPVVTWAVAAGSGSIDMDGIYLAGEPGQTTVSATAGVATNSVTLRVNAAPTVQIAVATDTPVISGTTAIFTVQGADDDNVDLLSYSWTATGPKAVGFVPRTGTAAESTTATFHAIGDYTITAVISDKQGLTTTSSLAVTVLPTSTSLTIAPTTNVVVNPGLTKPFIATVRDQFKAIMYPQPVVTWAVTAGSGSIGTDGIYLAGEPGQTTVSATAGAATGSVTLRVNAAPTVQTAVATDTPEITGTTATFTVQGADDDNVDLLSYSWTATGPRSVSFVPRSGVTAESTTATFTAAGIYTIVAKITDKQALSTISSLTVTVLQTPTGLALNATTIVLNPRAAKVFAVQSRDQFNAVITGATIPAVTWSATGGTIDAVGRYVAGLSPGPAVVTAEVATEPVTTLTADVRINAAPTVAEPAVATVTSPTTLTLHALGADDGGVANTAYTWTVLAGAPGSVVFSGATQNTNAAQTIQATLSVAGGYTFSVRIRDAQGLYTTSTVSVSTGQTIPAIVWSTPAAVVYGTALSAAQLNATSPVDGVFSYTPALGATLDAGTNSLGVLFTPTDGVTYTTATATVDLVVTPAPTTVTWAPLAPITWGTPLGAAQQTATASVPGSFDYTPAAGTVPEVGTQTLAVLFTPTSPNYAPSTATNALQVRKIPSVLTWASPASIAVGSALTGTQCNASAAQAGVITYVPPIGTVLTEGFHVLRATFTPSDAAHATSAQATVRIRVIDTTPPTTTYQYDNANRLTDRIYADGKRDTFGYDAAGRLTSATSQRYSNTVGRSYDDAGRLTEERLTMDGRTDTVGSTYDNVNRPTGLTYPDGSQVQRTYTPRNQLKTVKWNGDLVASRDYDDGGRLETTTYGDQVQSESRTYHAGSNMVATIQVPGVTDFSYDYDSVWRKSAERDLTDTSRSQHFRYDDASRLTDWRKGATYAAPASTRTWDLSLVGDWKHTTVDGVTESREHTAVHEIASVNGQNLEHDVRGNLSRGLPYADGSEARLAWDVENRLASATASDADWGATGTATYRYDALGRRVQKTVWGDTTTYVHSGAQVVQRTTVPQVLPEAAADDDGDLVAVNGTPPGADYLGGGGILAAAQQRVNFQPERSAIPEGFVADKGKASAERSNGLTYGWVVAQAGQVERRAYPLPQFDTHIRMQADGQSSPGTWSMALSNGTYAVVVVMGDPTSRNQTNDVSLNGIACPDPSPATTEIEYRKGDFDGYIENITVSDGFLTIAAQATAFDAKLCFVEIGPEGVLATQAERDRLAAVIEAANNQTAKNKPASQDVASYVYGSYVDEVLCYQATVGAVTERYYPHYNHLYSVAVLTGSTGAVVEKYAYTAYGKQAITAGVGGAVRQKSAVGWDRGFTGYIEDDETDLLFARMRMYSPAMGRFTNRDPFGYVDGFNAYQSYFIPGTTDPFGLITDEEWAKIIELVKKIMCEQATEVAVDKGVEQGWNVYRSQDGIRVTTPFTDNSSDHVDFRDPANGNPRNVPAGGTVVGGLHAHTDVLPPSANDITSSIMGALMGGGSYVMGVGFIGKNASYGQLQGKSFMLIEIQLAKNFDRFGYANLNLLPSDRELSAMRMGYPVTETGLDGFGEITQFPLSEYAKGYNEEHYREDPRDNDSLGASTGSVGQWAMKGGKQAMWNLQFRGMQNVLRASQKVGVSIPRSSGLIKCDCSADAKTPTK